MASLKFIFLCALFAVLINGIFGAYFLQNEYTGGYLSTGNHYDGERREVTTSYRTTFSEKWYLKNYGNKYEIYTVIGDERLYAAGNSFSKDNSRRSVFTWKNGESVSQGYWEITQRSNGLYTIRNTYHGEYLYSADYPSRGTIYTWSGDSINFNDKFYWRLIETQYDHIFND